MFLKRIFFEGSLISKGGEGILLFKRTETNSNDVYGSSLQKKVFFFESLCVDSFFWGAASLQ